jgi:hypothetical protein
MRHRPAGADQSDFIVTLHVNDHHEFTSIRLADQHEAFLADCMNQVWDCLPM